MTRRRSESGPSSVLNFRVTAEERAELERKAAAAGVSVSEIVRRSAVASGSPTPEAADRKTVDLAGDEGVVLAALAARAGIGESDFVRRLIQAERERTDFVEARPGPAKPGWFCAATSARFAYSLHHVAGRAEPLCVRRRTLGREESYEVEFGRGRAFSVPGDELDDRGEAASYGDSAAHRTHPKVRTLDGVDFYDLEPHVIVYRDVPTPAQRATWKGRRALEQDLLLKLRRDRFVDVWRLLAPDQPDQPARASRRRAFRTKWPEHRGDLRVVDDAQQQAQFYENAFGFDKVNVYELAEHGFQVTGTANVIGRMAIPADLVKYVLRQPTRFELEREGRSEWAHKAREFRKDREREAEEAERRRRGEPRAKSPFDGFFIHVDPVPRDELAVLGLTEACTPDDVNRAKKQAARDHHPDHGGDEAKMKRAMAAADVVLKWIGRRAA